MSFDNLIEKIKEKNNPTVMGLDPKLDFIPNFIKREAVEKYGETFEAAGEAIWQFNKGLIDGAADFIPAVKPQSAFYEMYGIPGMVALERTIKYAKSAGLYVILDVKRNDIGSTAEAYASAYIGKTELFSKKEATTDVDCLTVNPYLGFDGIEPFVKSAVENSKSMFILVKTSNKSSSEFQDIEFGGKTLYSCVAEKVEIWGLPHIGKYGYSPCGAVVGATYPIQLCELRKVMPHTFFLIPGYGTQGGTAKDIVGAFDKNGSGAIVNSSRALICAYQKTGSNGDDFIIHTKNAVISMKNDLNNIMSRI